MGELKPCQLYGKSPKPAIGGLGGYQPPTLSELTRRMHTYGFTEFSPAVYHGLK